MISERIHDTRTDDMHIKPVLCIQVAELAVLLRLIYSRQTMQSYYCYLFYCLNKETWVLKLLSS